MDFFYDIYGLFKYFILDIHLEPVYPIPARTAEGISKVLVLRAFSSGCSALTGVEAVSNSVPNFQEPSQKNAKTVMLILEALIFFIFGGTSILAIFYTAVPVANGPTVVSQIAFGIFHNAIMYYIIQISTAVILLMACNTAHTGFPMLMYIVGKDGFAPRQSTTRGKRLSFSFGIGAFVTFLTTIIILVEKFSQGVFVVAILIQLRIKHHYDKVPMD